MVSAKWQCSLLEALALPLVAGLIVAGFQYCDTRPAELYTVYFESLGVLTAIALLTLGDWRTARMLAMALLVAVAAYLLASRLYGIGFQFTGQLVHVVLPAIPVAAIPGCIELLLRRRRESVPRRIGPLWAVLLCSAFLCGLYVEHLVVTFRWGGMSAIEILRSLDR
jgi:hypothetical protein